MWFDVGGAALISAANPPLDAARLDIMPAGLWGRAESTRTVLRSLAQALAPLLFGGLSSLIAGIVPAQAPVGTHPARGVRERGSRTRVHLPDPAPTLAAAGVFLARARHTYSRDVATAGASQQWASGAAESPSRAQSPGAEGPQGAPGPGHEVAPRGND